MSFLQKIWNTWFAFPPLHRHVICAGNSPYLKIWRNPQSRYAENTQRGGEHAAMCSKQITLLFCKWSLPKQILASNTNLGLSGEKQTMNICLHMMVSLDLWFVAPGLKCKAKHEEFSSMHSRTVSHVHSKPWFLAGMENLKSRGQNCLPPVYLDMALGTLELW